MIACTLHTLPCTRFISRFQISALFHLQFCLRQPAAIPDSVMHRHSTFPIPQNDRAPAPSGIPVDSST